MKTVQPITGHLGLISRQAIGSKGVHVYSLLFVCFFFFNPMLPKHKTMTNGLHWCPDSRHAAASGGRWKPEFFWHPSLKLFVLSKHRKYGPVFQRIALLPLGSASRLFKIEFTNDQTCKIFKLGPGGLTIAAWCQTDSSSAAAELTWCNTMQRAAHSNLLFPAT